MPKLPDDRARPAHLGGAVLSRRRLLQAGAAVPFAGLAARPAIARAGVPARERRFLFVFVSGGWDLSWGLYPMFDNPRVDSPTDGSAPATAGGLQYVDGPGRPSVRRWFNRWASATSLLHGFEVRSVAHANCRRLVLTGTAGAYGDDWPTLIAAHGVGPDTALPHLIVSGPGFSGSYPEIVGRVGATGQLSALLNMGMLERRDVPLAPLLPSGQEAVAAWLANRSASVASSAPTAAARQLHEDLASARAGLPALEAAFAETAVGTAIEFPDQLRVACDVLQGGISRCALVRHNGFQDTTWDNHGGIEAMALHHEDLFSGLEVLMDELTERPGLAGGRLLDDTCVVVVSEMSRHPQLNGTMGKDHWTWTSAMLIGAGVAGGTMVGEYDDEVFGRSIDPNTGAPSTSGVKMESRHLGATLLALADIDPDRVFELDTPPIAAVMAE